MKLFSEKSLIYGIKIVIARYILMTVENHFKKVQLFIFPSISPKTRLLTGIIMMHVKFEVNLLLYSRDTVKAFVKFLALSFR